MLGTFSLGPVVMDMSGYSEKGLKRKLAVQSLFGKIFYLSEVSSLKVVCNNFYFKVSSTFVSLSDIDSPFQDFKFIYLFI